MKRVPLAMMLLTLANGLLVAALLRVVEKHPTLLLPSMPRPQIAAPSPVAPAELPAERTPAGNILYVVGTDEQAELLRRMDPEGRTTIITSASDEWLLDQELSDGDDAGLPALEVVDLRLDGPPPPEDEEMIQSRVEARLPGVSLDPAYQEAVTYYIVDSAEQSALLNATLQQLAHAGVPAPAPVSRYAIAVEKSPEDAVRFWDGLDDFYSRSVQEGPTDYRVVNLKGPADSGTSEGQVRQHPRLA